MARQPVRKPSQPRRAGISPTQAHGLLDVLGHQDISPKRKVDAGPAFPLPSIRSKILGRVDG